MGNPHFAGGQARDRHPTTGRRGLEETVNGRAMKRVQRTRAPRVGYRKFRDVAYLSPSLPLHSRGSLRVTMNGGAHGRSRSMVNTQPHARHPRYTTTALGIYKGAVSALWHCGHWVPIRRRTRGRRPEASELGGQPNGRGVARRFPSWAPNWPANGRCCELCMNRASPAPGNALLVRP